MSSPRLVFYDVETSPIDAYAWRTFKEFIAPNQIKEPSRLICWAAKERKKPIQFASEVGGHEAMVSKLHTLLSNADAVVGYNHVSFDNKVVNVEFLKYGFPPVPPAKQIDLYRIVKKHFRLPSYKLEYVARAFGIGQKVKHEGFELWKACLDGDTAAWKRMERYNRGDCVLVERLYEKLLPYIGTHPSHSVLGHRSVCVNCGSRNLQRRGKHITKTGVFNRLACQSCGTWQRERVNELPKGTEVLVGL